MFYSPDYFILIFQYVRLINLTVYLSSFSVLYGLQPQLIIISAIRLQSYFLFGMYYRAAMNNFFEDKRYQILLCKYYIYIVIIKK